MRLSWKTIISSVALFSLGYLTGLSGRPGESSIPGEFASAVADGESPLSDDAARKILAANKALSEAAEALKQEGRYESATKGINAFLVLSGGGNAKQELEAGVVDPETFAALYVGDEVAPDLKESLDKDSEGRVTFANQVVRMYSKNRLKRVFAERAKLSETQAPK